MKLYVLNVNTIVTQIPSINCFWICRKTKSGLTSARAIVKLVTGVFPSVALKNSWTNCSGGCNIEELKWLIIR